MDSAGMTLVAEAAMQAGGSAPLEATYGTSLGSDAAMFSDSLMRVDKSASAGQGIAQTLFEPLDNLNNSARELAEYAQSSAASGNELTPSEIVSLTARSQEFMFHAQLTANVANRTADGMQQLFRQQG